jgi:hypothetical protein
MLVSCLSYSSTLKMEANYSSETSVEFQYTTWHYILEDITLHNHRCENLKISYDNFLFVVFLTTLSVTWIAECRQTKRLVNTELTKIWQKLIEGKLSRNLPGGREEYHENNSVTRAGLRAEIWTLKTRRRIRPRRSVTRS